MNVLKGIISLFITCLPQHIMFLNGLYKFLANMEQTEKIVESADAITAAMMPTRPKRDTTRGQR